MRPFRWPMPPKAFLVVKKPEATRATAALLRLLPTLNSLGVTTYLESAVWDEIHEQRRHFNVKKFKPGKDVRGPRASSCARSSVACRYHFPVPHIL